MVAEAGAEILVLARSGSFVAPFPPPDTYNNPIERERERTT